MVNCHEKEGHDIALTDSNVGVVVEMRLRLTCHSVLRGYPVARPCAPEHVAGVFVITNPKGAWKKDQQLRALPTVLNSGLLPLSASPSCGSSTLHVNLSVIVGFIT